MWGRAAACPASRWRSRVRSWQVTVVDKVQKKVAFLTQAKLELGLSNLDCLHARVEEVDAPPFDLIVARAFSSLEDFVRVSAHLLAPGGWWAAMKGVYPDAELAALGRRDAGRPRGRRR